jgi:hypothetical protein
VEAVKAADADGSIILFAPLGFITLFRTSTRRSDTSRRILRRCRPPSPSRHRWSWAEGAKRGKDACGLIEWSRGNSRHATYGTPGVGTSLHFIGAMLDAPQASSIFTSRIRAEAQFRMS